MAETEPNGHRNPATADPDLPDFGTTPVAPEQPAWVRWSSGLLIAAGFGYALYAIRILFLLRYTTVHGDFWIIYDRLFQIPFPANVFVPENGHSMVVPSLIWWANMLVFRGDETPLFVIALALLISM